MIILISFQGKKVSSSDAIKQLLNVGEVRSQCFGYTELIDVFLVAVDRHEMEARRCNELKQLQEPQLTLRIHDSDYSRRVRKNQKSLIRTDSTGISGKGNHHHNVLMITRRHLEFFKTDEGNVGYHGNGVNFF